MTDQQILELYWARNEDAIDETDKLYGRYFRFIAREILCDEEDAKETVNDTYLKAWNIIPPQRPNPLKAFLGRITRQLSINRLEQNTAQKRGGGQYTLALDELAECIPDGSSEENLVDKIALTDALNRFLQELPKEQRQIFLLRYWYACSIRDIAGAFYMGQSKFTSILVRVRKKLKEHLEKEGFAV
jgi:RNA polymerase sigma-70 factor (ECF subfamily)